MSEQDYEYEYQPPVESDEEFDPFNEAHVQAIVSQAVEEQLGPLAQALEPLAQQVTEEQQAEQDAYAENWVNSAMERHSVPPHAREQVLVMSGGYRLAGLEPEAAIAAAAETLQRSSAVSKDEAAGRPRTMEEAALRIARRRGIS
jgi:hypothetical protein